jgi:hypothetical protein
MTLAIERLTPRRETDYVELLRSVPGALVFQTLHYRDFLATILENSEDRYLLAVDGDRVVGALPCFLKKNAKHGNVLNSLPFYGSNGGVLVAPSCPDAPAVRRALLHAFQDVAKAESVVASTIVSSPLDPQEELYRETTGFNLTDERIGQITPLPRVGKDTSDAAVADALMAVYHTKTRNIVRKGLLSGAIVSHDDSLESMQALAKIHDDNMRAIGGTSKPWAVFEAVREAFEYDVDYRVYSARLDGRTISALLVFFHNDACDYYTPATIAEFRGQQPGSLLIYRAMHDAVRRGCAHWNWGGTWLTQKGVYDFKSKWGTRDWTYRYYVREYPHSELRGLDRATILREYPYYYTVPFDVLTRT